MKYKKRRQPERGTSAVPFPEEIRHLAEVASRLDTALKAAEGRVGLADEHYMDTKRYMVETVSYTHLDVYKRQAVLGRVSSTFLQ